MSRNDLLILPVISECYIDYYGHVQTVSMLCLSLIRPPGKSTFDFLAEVIESVKQRGGAAYMETPKPGEPWVPPYVHERAKVDYAEGDFAGIRWGKSVEANGRVFRKILSVRDSA